MKLTAPLHMAHLTQEPPLPEDGYLGIYTADDGQLRVSRPNYGSDPVTLTSPAMTSNVTGGLTSSGGVSLDELDLPVTQRLTFVRYFLAYTTSAGTARPSFRITGPSPADVGLRVFYHGSTNTPRIIPISALDTWSNDPGLNSTGVTVGIITIEGYIWFNGSGTLRLYAGTSSGTVTIHAGSYAIYGKMW